jgi:RNA polymerase sigma-70 factor (ECF subfamily)
MTKPSAKLDFDAILRNTHHRIRAYIAGLGVAAGEVDNAAQDVYLKFYRNLDQVPDDVAPQRWLKGIARDICVDRIRRSVGPSRLQREALFDILIATETETHRQATEGSLSMMLEECCRQLSADNRTLLELRYQQNLSTAAIATRMHTTEEVVRATLFRIRASLNTCVSRQLAGKS